MAKSLRFMSLIICLLIGAELSLGQTLNPNQPTWWQKYQTLLKNGAGNGAGPSSSVTVGSNVDLSNECGPKARASSR